MIPNGNVAGLKLFSYICVMLKKFRFEKKSIALV
jgi:hypothetical protein